MSRYRRDDPPYDDLSPGGHWDRSRFERARARSRGPYARAPYDYPSYDYDNVRVEEFERDRYFPRGKDVQENIRVEVRDDRRRESGGGRGGGYYERDRYVEDDYVVPRYRRPDFLDQDRERDRYAGREMQVYAARREYDDYNVGRRPRPSYVRRQSSLDSYDRRPLPRYGDREERDVNVSINVQAPPPLPPAIPRVERYEYRREPEPEPEPEPEVIIREEKKKEIIRQTEREKEIEIEDDYISIDVPEAPRRKRGKTRMPKRLVHKAALNRLEYPYQEEDNFFIVQFAMKKEEIDEVIKMSEIFFDDNKSVFMYGDTKETKLLEGPASVTDDEVKIEEKITRKIIKNPTPSEIYRLEHEVPEDFATGVRSLSSSPTGSMTTERDRDRERRPTRSVKSSRSSKSKARSGRSRSTRRRGTVVEESEEEEEEEIVIGPSAGALILPERNRKGDREIDKEIKKLEAEKRALKLDREARELERKAERIREGDYEVAEGGRDRSVVVTKDKRGRLALVRH